METNPYLTGWMASVMNNVQHQPMEDPYATSQDWLTYSPTAGSANTTRLNTHIYAPPSGGGSGGGGY